MKFFKAKVADIVRAEQRDQLFIKKFQNELYTVCKSVEVRSANKFSNIMPLYAALWYYTCTSLSNLQTLGEEYTGTLRLTDQGRLPNKLLQMIWLACYIGGEPLSNKLIKNLEKKITHSETMEPKVKAKLLAVIAFLNTNKDFIVKMHHFLFYIYGDYYHISSRVTKIRHVLLREWLQDSTSSWGFKLLGQFSLIYLIIYFISQCFNTNKETVCTRTESTSGKICPLCTEIRRDTCVTPCGHLYCWKCIYEAISHQGNCPLCRETINPSRIVFLQNYA